MVMMMMVMIQQQLTPIQLNIPILQMRKLRHRETTHTHTVGKWHSQDWKPDGGGLQGSLLLNTQDDASVFAFTALRDQGLEAVSRK